jgi:hypothetical protein
MLSLARSCRSLGKSQSVIFSIDVEPNSPQEYGGQFFGRVPRLFASKTALKRKALASNQSFIGCDGNVTVCLRSLP